MAWPVWSSETSGTDGRIAGEDYNAASAYNTSWVDEALTAGAITVDGDGKFRVTYSGAQDMDTITGTTAGDIGQLSADVTGAGGNLTLKHNVGNIWCANGGFDIVIAANLDFVHFTHIGAWVVIKG